MLLNKERSCLLLIDIQEKLTPLTHNSEQMLKRCQWLLKLARQLHIPVLVSEQYPKGLGHTVPSLKEGDAIEKTTFSCMRTSSYTTKLASLNRNQCVLAGIETHVCVLQTAMEMHAAGLEVFVVADAVSSRNPIDYEYALTRMRQAGIQIVTGEMVFFEWLGDSRDPQFKTLSKEFLQ